MRECPGIYFATEPSGRTADLLRQRGLDAVSAHEVGNTQLEDRAQLQCAAREGRALVTCDVIDFIALATGMIAANVEHAGIALVPSSFATDELAAIADAIQEVARRHPAGAPGAVILIRRGGST